MTRQIIDLLPDYFRSNIKIRKQYTRDHYYKSFRRFAEYLGHEPTLDDLTDDVCTGFILWSVENEKVTEVTANQRAKQIRALWNWAAKRRLVEQFPVFQDIAEPEQIPKAWTPEQLAKLFSTCERQQGWIGPTPANLWWLALHHFLLDTGERTEAALSIEWDWYDAESGTVTVPARVRKGGVKAMVYRVSRRTVDLFEQIRQPLRTRIFERAFLKGAFLSSVPPVGERSRVANGAGEVWPEEDADNRVHDD